MAFSSKNSDSVAESEYLSQEIAGSDRLAQMVSEKYRTRLSVKLLFDRQTAYIIDLLKSEHIESILDLGCGMGNFLVRAQAFFPVVYGVDPAPQSLQLAKELVPDADLRLGTGESLPMDAEQIDAVVMKGVVHHLKDPQPTFQEIRRCLKPGGILVIFEGNRYSVYRRLMLWIADLVKCDHESTLFEHRSPRHMKQMLESAGLQPFLCRNISGFFAPLALSGIGGPGLWKILSRLEDKLQRYCPWLFNYYVLIGARKPE